MRHHFGDDWDHIDPDERRQRLAKARNDHDDEPVTITYRQATLMAVLVDAAANGHWMPEALEDIAAFLRLAATNDGLRGRLIEAGTEDPAVIWERVEQWPVPPPGPPRQQEH